MKPTRFRRARTLVPLALAVLVMMGTMVVMVAPSAHALPTRNFNVDADCGSGPPSYVYGFVVWKTPYRITVNTEIYNGGCGGNVWLRWGYWAANGVTTQVGQRYLPVPAAYSRSYWVETYTNNTARIDWFRICIMNRCSPYLTP
jgi:hypothetical protein